MKTHYTPGGHGYVVRSMVGPGSVPSWWYGPEHGWGTTSGGLDYSVAVFATRAGAKLALERSGYNPKRTRVVTVAAAEREVAEHRARIGASS